MSLRCTAHIARALWPLGTLSLLNVPRGVRYCSIIASALFHTPVILPSISRVVRCLSPHPPITQRRRTCRRLGLGAPHCWRSAWVVPPRTSPAAIIRWYPRSAKSKHSAATGHSAQSSRRSGSSRCPVSASIHSAKRAKACGAEICPTCRRSAIHCSAQAMRAFGVSFAWIA